MHTIFTIVVLLYPATLWPCVPSCHRYNDNVSHFLALYSSILQAVAWLDPLSHIFFNLLRDIFLSMLSQPTSQHPPPPPCSFSSFSICHPDKCFVVFSRFFALFPLIRPAKEIQILTALRYVPCGPGITNCHVRHVDVPGCVAPSTRIILHPSSPACRVPPTQHRLPSWQSVPFNRQLSLSRCHHTHTTHRHIRPRIRVKLSWDAGELLRIFGNRYQQLFGTRTRRTWDPLRILCSAAAPLLLVLCGFNRLFSSECVSFFGGCVCALN